MLVGSEKAQWLKVVRENGDHPDPIPQVTEPFKGEPKVGPGLSKWAELIKALPKNQCVAFVLGAKTGSV